MNINDSLKDALTKMFIDMHARFGDVVRGYWLYESDDCPGCGQKAQPFPHKGREALSLNIFIYRERGILIGYVLCGRCGKKVIQAGKQHPGRQIALHDTIEATLKRGYDARLN